MASVAERLKALEEWPFTGTAFVQRRLEELAAIRAEVEEMSKKLRWHAGEARKWSYNDETSNLLVHASWMESQAARLAPEEKP